MFTQPIQWRPLAERSRWSWRRRRGLVERIHSLASPTSLLDRSPSLSASLSSSCTGRSERGKQSSWLEDFSFFVHLSCFQFRFLLLFYVSYLVKFVVSTLYFCMYTHTDIFWMDLNIWKDWFRSLQSDISPRYNFWTPSAIDDKLHWCTALIEHISLSDFTFWNKFKN